MRSGWNADLQFWGNRAQDLRFRRELQQRQQWKLLQKQQL